MSFIETKVSQPFSEGDTGWKSVVLDAYFPRLLTFFYPHLYEKIDWKQGYQFLDKELQAIIRDAVVGKRCVDKLVRVFMRWSASCCVTAFENSLKASVQIHKTMAGHNKYNFAQFFGFYTAHMVTSLEDLLEGENVSPLLAIQKMDEAWIERFGSSAYACAVAKAKERYDTIPIYSGEYALFAYAAFLTQADKYKEGLKIQAYENKERVGITYFLTIPYRSACSEKDLAIGQIKIVLPGSFPNSDIGMFLNNFKEGACAHTKGFEFWNNHWDCDSDPIVIVKD